MSPACTKRPSNKTARHYAKSYNNWQSPSPREGGVPKVGLRNEQRGELYKVGKEYRQEGAQLRRY